MTQTPPVPPANTSPYPIEEPPHARSAPGPADEWAEPVTARGWSLGRIIGAAAGVGAIAFGVAAVLFPRESADAPKPKKKNAKS